MMNMLKKCKDCEIIKDIKEFYKSISSKDGYQNKCKGCSNIYDKKYREKNKDKIEEKKKEWREENKNRRNEHRRNRKSKDPLYKLSENIRTLICISLRNNGYKKGSKTNNILGCSFEELLDHLNDNKYGFIYGDDNLDIDHIKPLSKATSEDEIIKLNHYSNLQLLPSEYNRYVKINKDFDDKCLEEWLLKRLK